MELPECKPYQKTLRNISSDDFRTRYKAMRNMSSYYTGRSDVREVILNKCGAKCYLCCAKGDLQVDHVISVYRFAKDRLPYRDLNKYENLMPICKRCNAAKIV